jgi:spore coat protein H
MRRLLAITLLIIVVFFLSRMVLAQSRKERRTQVGKIAEFHKIPEVERAAEVHKTAELTKAAKVRKTSEAPKSVNVVKPKGDTKAADVFQPTKIWEVHLTFSPDQWQAMQPKQGPRGQRDPGARGVPLLGPEGGRNGFLAAAGMVFDYVNADLKFGEHAFKDVGVRYKGNGTFMTSQRTLKRSLKIDLNQYEKGQEFAGISQLNLHNSVRDPSSMNEAVAYRLFREGGVPASRTAYAKVFVTVPDLHDRQYFGLYTLVEDVNHAMLEEQLGVKKGALLKPVTAQPFTDRGEDWEAYNQTYDPKGKISDEQKARVIEFCKFVSSVDDETFAARLPEYLDLDNFARYMAITAWLCDFDGLLGPGQNYYVYLHPKTQKFMFLPWDQDQTFGQFAYGGNEQQRENLDIHHPWSGDRRFLERVFKTEVFKEIYLARLREFNDSIFQPKAIHQQVDELARVLRQSVQEESAERLAQLSKAAAGERVTIYMGQVGSGGTPVKPIKSFVEARRASVSDQLAGKAVPSPAVPR